MVDLTEDLKEASIEGNRGKAKELTEKALEEGISAKRLISDAIIPATEEIGDRYEAGIYFLSDLVRSGKALETIMKPILARLEEEVGEEGEERAGRITLATVEGDIHDIGKNIVKLFLQGSGFVVYDLGVDVPAEEIVDEALDSDSDMIGLSCLMSVTRDNVKRIVEELEEREIREKLNVLVGGRSTNAEWAERIGCDEWAADGPEAVESAKRLISRRGV